MPELEIWHGGQTGVDRGAHYGAIDCGAPINGYAPFGRNDEDGPIPNDVIGRLQTATFGGYKERTRLNVIATDAVLAIVADRIHPYATDGTAATLKLARLEYRPHIAVDASTPIEYLAHWLRPLVDAARPLRFRLMVCGPRRSRWALGEATARKIVADLAPRFR